ncbi:MAG: Verru Chthon cassette protein, partial [Verrucomicrobiales bacterium]|nr:Verru Chthon cassette protein [Verrucomicrobiales bacterium]
MKSGPIQKKSRRGVAILTVLALVTLCTVLVVSLLQTGVREKQLSSGAINRQSAERHADTALQMVLAQLRGATTPATDDATPAPWSSQPGAITVHHRDGSVDKIHKLYSAAEPTTADPDAIAASDLPQHWQTVPGQFTDLNEPAMDAKGRAVFPIADPRLAGPDGAEGFSILPAKAPDGTTRDTVKQEADRRLPMPVRWIYLLQDGTPGVLDAAGRFTSAQGHATRENPITARIAWWADDESSKINVNTAGEASPWDTPRLTTEQDRDLAINQPMRGEYHRYPGHPAGVSLSTVLFPNNRWLQPGDVALPHEKAMSARMAEGLWSLAAGSATDPEMTSAGGTRRPPGLELPLGNGTADPWHLYQSPHEITMAPDRSRRKVFAQFPEAATRLARADFLLTAESRAPETTLFGTPRISLWPVHESVQPGLGISSPVERASGTDTLIALCATAGPTRYYMQRSTPGDGSGEFQKTGLGANARLFQWLTGLMEKPVPGFVRESGSRTFADKYGAGPDGDSRNIAALMLDYIRTTNLADGAIPRENQFSIVCPGNETEGYGQISPLETARGTTGQARWRNDQLEAARGLGRMPTLNGAVLVLTCRAWCDASGAVVGSPSSETARLRLNKPGARELEGALLFEGFIPGQGWAESRPYCSLIAAGLVPGAPPDFSQTLPAFLINGQSMTPLPAAGLTKFREVLNKRNRMPEGWTASGGASATMIANSVIFAPVVVDPGPANSNYLLFNGTTGSNSSAPGFKVGLFDSPGVSQSSVSSYLGDLVQVVELNFPLIPQQALPLPTLPTDGTALTFEDRLIDAFTKGRPLLSPQDIAQALVPAHGDSRLLAGRRVIPAQAFTAHPDYGRKPLAHRLPHEPGSSAAAASGPGFFQDLNQPATALPEFPIKPWDSTVPVVHAGDSAYQVVTSTMAGTFAANRLDQGRRGPATPAETGDFDTASGRAPDGPFINRADDGELRGYQAGGVPYFDAPPSDPKTVPAVSAAASSPNRLVPGPGMFGSLPTGVKANVPWQTLLFRPDTGPDNIPRHYGTSWPPDHLLLDLFWMPVVEPYGISTPLETAGKVNLNHKLLPFSHIHRATALHALLKSERLIAVADADAALVKMDSGFSDATTRFPIDATGTIKIWDEATDRQNRPFICAGEVCALPLVPGGVDPDPAVIQEWWHRHRLTGDNLKERPYTNLHARLTTRSNTFRVHVQAQCLAKAKSSDPAKWDDSADQVLST